MDFIQRMKDINDRIEKAEKKIQKELTDQEHFTLNDFYKFLGVDKEREEALVQTTRFKNVDHVFVMPCESGGKGYSLVNPTIERLNDICLKYEIYTFSMKDLQLAYEGAIRREAEQIFNKALDEVDILEESMMEKIITELGEKVIWTMGWGKVDNPYFALHPKGTVFDDFHLEATRAYMRPKLEIKWEDNKNG